MSEQYGLENKGAGWKLRCPGCGEWASIDDDQFNGRVSVFHDVEECGFHETIDFSKHV